MPETLLIAAIISKIKHYRIRYLFSEWSFYPELIVQVILIFFQVSIFCDTYYFVRYSLIIQRAVLVAYLFPLFALKLYKPAMIGSVSVVVGTILNNFVISQNGGKMPVYPTLSYLTGYVKFYSFDVADSLHVLGNEMTRFKFLTDYIDLGYAILSIGDLFIHFFSIIMLYNMVKAANERHASEIG